MHVGHVVATFPPYWGGTGDVAYHHDLRGDIRWQFSPYQALVGPLVLRTAARVIAVSLDHFDASPMRRYVRDERLAELPNGADLTRFDPSVDGRSVREKLGIPLD